ncbi:MAG: hypothetical protein ACW987_18710 [Candidatus Thorarchaeota archaeon]|jgi:hypothetical protein
MEPLSLWKMKETGETFTFVGVATMYGIDHLSTGTVVIGFP